MYYHTCPKCGSNNDPGEVCECEKNNHNQMQANKTNIKKSQSEKTAKLNNSKCLKAC